ncbi:hypothetical protein Tco_0645924 [Tanacetum coccineum]
MGVVEEEDGEHIHFLGGNSSSGTKKYRGSNSNDGGNTRDEVKIAGGVIRSGDEIGSIRAKDCFYVRVIEEEVGDEEKRSVMVPYLLGEMILVTKDVLVKLETSLEVLAFFGDAVARKERTREHIGKFCNEQREEDGEQIHFLGGNSSSGTKKYRGSNSNDGGNTGDGVKIAGGVIRSSDEIGVLRLNMLVRFLQLR